ncbi:farnesol dehydrogenase [Bactrocera dorsalis]|uniref:Farnesol dehydrogenase n=1 Tax=Bactrocera dorsalis TaxID=27457 RepID=A0A6I9URD2_BACDO|nr:farnesol dehydrogenase [Bactrocera dorsalis]
MERWSNRVAVVTGASSGIGAATVKYLASNGMVTVGLARRVERIESLRDEVEDEARERIHALKCDVTDEQQVVRAFAEIERSYGPIAVLVNNAGVARTSTSLLQPKNLQDIRDVIDTNILGVIICTREAFRSMKAQGDDGHVFLINSICGHRVPIFPNTKVNVYPPSKFAVTALTEVYRQEFLDQQTKVKITSISPGLVDTEIHVGESRKALASMPYLKPEDIADALIYCLQTPPNVQVHELTIKPIGETI